MDITAFNRNTRVSGEISYNPQSDEFKPLMTRKTQKTREKTLSDEMMSLKLSTMSNGMSGYR